jgi:hypothetical protein
MKAEGFVIRRKGTEQVLSEVDTTNGEPYSNTAGYADLGSYPYFYPTEEAAQGALTSDGEIVPATIQVS